MKKIITKGHAVGLSSHSSMQESSEIFKKSEIFEVSSISRNEDESGNSNERFLSQIVLFTCRFCGRSNRQKEIFKVCCCEERFMAHGFCVRGQSEGKCKKCGSVWFQEGVGKGEVPEILLSETIRQSSLSVLNESSGEKRMKNAMKAAVKTPKCRICSLDNDNETNKIIYPCQCHTIYANLAWAHRDCVLIESINTQKDKCPRCKADFSFQPIFKTIWICKETGLLHEYLGELSKILTFCIVISGLIAILVELQDFYYGKLYLKVWGGVLLAVLSAILTAFVVGFAVILWKQSTRKVVDGLIVLCQKQEIAKMSSSSHMHFQAYIEGLKKKKLIKSFVKEPKETKEVEFKGPEVGASRHMPQRTVLELDTNGENLDSEMIREVSSPKLVSFTMNNSEDFKEEDIKEHSDEY